MRILKFKVDEVIPSTEHRLEGKCLVPIQHQQLLLLVCPIRMTSSVPGIGLCAYNTHRNSLNCLHV